MKIVWKEQVKEDLKQLEKHLKNTKPLRKAIHTAISHIQKGGDLSEILPVNRITKSGVGWFDCYLYKDIVMIYKTHGNRVIIISIGTPTDRLKRR